MNLAIHNLESRPSGSWYKFQFDMDRSMRMYKHFIWWIILAESIDKFLFVIASLNVLELASFSTTSYLITVPFFCAYAKWMWSRIANHILWSKLYSSCFLNPQYFKGFNLLNFVYDLICKAFMLQIMRDPETGNSRGFGFISYDSFEASDSAIEVCFSLLF